MASGYLSTGCDNPMSPYPIVKMHIPISFSKSIVVIVGREKDRAHQVAGIILKYKTVSYNSFYLTEQRAHSPQLAAG